MRDEKVMLANTKDWLVIILQVISLITIVYSGIKIINKNEREWIQREDRLTIIEISLREIRDTILQIMALDSKLTELSTEMIRDRLDRFLDMQSGSRKS